ncbi:MAG: hypothetical protein IPM71_03970 [Bacteroidota bacterium]|nr:MAG: hypothetical protein IPM71_03970 [Bacteroidota bacterium]
MSKTVKYILIIALILGAMSLLVFSDKIGLGSIVAGAAGFFAAVKAKLFQTEPLSQRIQSIESEHAVKRADWDQVKADFDNQFRAMKARMDYLDYRSAKLTEQISKLDESEREALKKNSNLSDAEILDRLNNL